MVTICMAIRGKSKGLLGIKKEKEAGNHLRLKRNPTFLGFLLIYNQIQDGAFIRLRRFLRESLSALIADSPRSGSSRG